jgi:2-polyprenyl-6-methoxyphenol hydroxylase-like FAD-dependent oxidoreductase
VGLFLANELARYNIDFRIIEKNSTRSTWSKALMITSRTTEILENSGLSEGVLSKATIVEGLDIHFNQRPLGSISMDLVEQTTTRYPYPVMLEQPEVELSFSNDLNKRGHGVDWNSEATSIEMLKDRIEVQLRNGELIRAKYVVGCDGAHSFVRHSRPEWKFEGRPVSLLWAQCDGVVQDPQVSTARGAGFVGSKGRLGLRHQC